MNAFSRITICGLAAVAAIALTGESARGQGVVSLADEIIIISSGEQAKERARDSTRLGPIHGSHESGFKRVAGADEPRLGGKLPGRRPLDTLQAASRRIEASAPRERRSPIPPPALPTPRPPEVPLYGPIRLPSAEDEGPPNGLTLEQAIAMLVQQNPDLALKFQEIPKADADILTASLWSNPLIFAAAGGVPYGQYSPRRPGSTNYNITLVQPFDLNGKIRARTKLARANRHVLCASIRTPSAWRRKTCTLPLSTCWPPARRSATWRPAPPTSGAC